MLPEITCVTPAVPAKPIIPAVALFELFEILFGTEVLPIILLATVNVQYEFSKSIPRNSASPLPLLVILMPPIVLEVIFTTPLKTTGSSMAPPAKIPAIDGDFQTPDTIAPAFVEVNVMSPAALWLPIVLPVIFIEPSEW